MRKKSHTLVSRWTNDILVCFSKLATQTDPQPPPPPQLPKKLKIKTEEKQTNGENPFLLSNRLET